MSWGHSVLGSRGVSSPPTHPPPWGRTTGTGRTPGRGWSVAWDLTSTSAGVDLSTIPDQTRRREKGPLDSGWSSPVVQYPYQRLNLRVLPVVPRPSRHRTLVSDPVSGKGSDSGSSLYYPSLSPRVRPSLSPARTPPHSRPNLTRLRFRRPTRGLNPLRAGAWLFPPRDPGSRVTGLSSRPRSSRGTKTYNTSVTSTSGQRGRGARSEGRPPVGTGG